MAKKIEDLAKAWVDKNGELALGDGQFYVKSVEERKEIKPKKALEVLKGFFDEDQVMEKCVKISNTSVMDLAKETKRGLSTVVSNSLKDAGAVEMKPITVYRIVKKGSDNGRPEPKRITGGGTEQPAGEEA